MVSRIFNSEIWIFPPNKPTLVYCFFFVKKIWLIIKFINFWNSGFGKFMKLCDGHLKIIENHQQGVFKIQLFWEGHKNLPQLSSRFWRYLVENDCAKFSWPSQKSWTLRAVIIFQKAAESSQGPEPMIACLTWNQQTTTNLIKE